MIKQKKTQDNQWLRNSTKKQGHIHGVISRMLLGRGSNIIDASSAKTAFSNCFCWWDGQTDQTTDRPTDRMAYNSREIKNGPVFHKK